MTTLNATGGEVRMCSKVEQCCARGHELRKGCWVGLITLTGELNIYVSVLGRGYKPYGKKKTE